MRTERIRLTPEKLAIFLRKFKKGTIKNVAAQEVHKVIDQTLKKKIFVENLDDVYSIDSAGEMRQLIKTNSSPRRGSYNWEYARWKIVMGLPPHVKTGKMKGALTTTNIGNRVEISIPRTATTRTYVSKKGKVSTHNFGPVHERRKSILKATMVFGWQDMMTVVGETYKKEAEK